MNRGDLTINVDKAALLMALKENRTKHALTYDKAAAGYIRVTTKQIKEYLVRLTKGELLERAFLPAPPEDHTSDYSEAIEMLEWSRDDQIELTQQQFRQYVMDDWGWKDSWMVSNTAYLEA